MKGEKPVTIKVTGFFYECKRDRSLNLNYWVSASRPDIGTSEAETGLR
jgi:hypothetical protein